MRSYYNRSYSRNDLYLTLEDLATSTILHVRLRTGLVDAKTWNWQTHFTKRCSSYNLNPIVVDLILRYPQQPRLCRERLAFKIMADLMTWMQQFHSIEMHSSYDLHPIQIDLAPSATSLVWLTSRFKLASRREDIDDAIHAYRQSLELLVTRHPSVASVYNFKYM